jgi:alanine racemase
LLSGGRITIDTSALAHNYKLLGSLAAPAKVAAVVKANAYGIGLDVVVRKLSFLYFVNK